MHVALATCAELPDGDEDAAAVIHALAERGVQAESAAWDGDADWTSFALVVVRSTWDYADRRDEFLRWAESVPRILNHAHVLRWNTDKRYLAELAAAGVAVVPTRFVEPGTSFDPPRGRFVVKPTVSAGSRNTASYSDGQDARRLVERLLAEGRTVMVQPYVAEIDTRGETGLIYLGGRYSHAVRKSALLDDGQPPTGDLYLEESIRSSEPTPAELEVADRAIAAVPFPAAELLYARVDLVPTERGPTVLEVELAEPSLWLSYADGATDRFAEAIAGAVGSPSVV